MALTPLYTIRKTRYAWGYGERSIQRGKVVTVSPDLEAALNEAARRQGVAPEVLAVNALRERFVAPAELRPRDEWERGLLVIAQDCCVSRSDSALSREE